MWVLCLFTIDFVCVVNGFCFDCYVFLFVCVLWIGYVSIVCCCLVACLVVYVLVYVLIVLFVALVWVVLYVIIYLV